MTPPNPVDIAESRRAADRKELKRAKESGDWGAAFDVIAANTHEVESLIIRSLSRHEATQAEIRELGRLIEALMGRIGELAVALEERPEYNPRVSASNLDAQALSQSIESVDRKHDASIMALGLRVEGVISQVGEAPDPTKGRKGSGIAEIVHRLDSKATVAKLMLLAAIASAIGLQASDLVKWLLHLKG